MRHSSKVHRTALEATASVVVLTVLAIALAVPVHAAVYRVSTTGSDTPGCGSAGTPCRSLQYAVDLAGANDDEIRIAAGTYTGVSTRYGHTQLAYIRNKRVAIRGGFTTSNWTTPDPVANPTVLDAQGLGMVLYVSDDTGGYGEVVFEGLRITGGNATDAVSGEERGGGVHAVQTVHTRVTVDTCWVTGNTAETGAGGLDFWFSDFPTVRDSVIENNTPDGIKAAFSDGPTITGSTIADNGDAGISIVSAFGQTVISGNLVTGNSPGLYLSTISGTVSGNTISNNSVPSGQGGGGMYVVGSNGLTISNNVLTGNQGSSGGAIYMTGAYATVEDNIVVSNSAPFVGTSGGGGMYLDAGSTAHIDVLRNTVRSNSAYNQGGGMLLLGDITARDNLLEANTAYGGGGAVATMMGTLEGNRFVDNSAQVGGGLYLVNPMGVDLVRNEFHRNHATNGNGGGLAIWGGFFFDVSLDGNQAVLNTATGRGGGIYMESQDGDSDTAVDNTLVARNSAPEGAGMYVFGGTTRLNHSTIADHEDTFDSDGVGILVKMFASAGDAFFANSVITGNATGVHVHSGSATLDHTLWGDGPWANTVDWSGGSVTTTSETWSAPGFVSATGDDYHLAAWSPARDAAADAGVATDMEGDPRPHPDTGIPDLGADEHPSRVVIFYDGFESGNVGGW